MKPARDIVHVSIRKDLSANSLSVDLDMKKSTPPSAFLQQNNYLKKGGELIIAYQLEYYEKNLISSIYIRCLSVYGYMISIKHEEIV